MDVIARIFIAGGLLLTTTGVTFWGLARLGVGRLPGDMLVSRGNDWIAVPLATSLVLSILLTIVLNVVIRVWR